MHEFASLFRVQSFKKSCNCIIKSQTCQHQHNLLRVILADCNKSWSILYFPLCIWLRSSVRAQTRSILNSNETVSIDMVWQEFPEISCANDSLYTEIIGLSSELDLISTAPDSHGAILFIKNWGYGHGSLLTKGLYRIFQLCCTPHVTWHFLSFYSFPKPGRLILLASGLLLYY